MESESSTLGKRPAEDIQESEKSKVPRADSVTPAPAESSAIKEPTEGTSSQSAKRSSKAGKSRPPERARRGTRTEPRPEGEERTPRLPKRQCALLIGFSGTGYSGMQIQPTAKTIEGVLFKALVEAGAVSQDNADNPVKVNLNRAARTDAGVHAAGNVVSMKMIGVIPGVPDLVGRINELLPPEIRLWSFVRAQNSFNARTSCDSRKYTYFFPSYMLIPPKPGSGLHEALKSSSAASESTLISGLHPFWEGADASSTPDDDLSRKRQWRCSPDQFESLRATARNFERSHNFHNFTIGSDFFDRSSHRFMKSIEVADPVVTGETEWIAVLFHGQSFMLHQRKMMCVIVLASRMGVPPSIIHELLGPRRVVIPKMPALGLLLEYPIFDIYNRKITEANSKLEPNSAERRDPIDFESHRAQIDEFKQTHIYANMRAIEDRTGLFDAWIQHLDQYTGDDLNYLNAKGIIPETSVIKKGERRANPFKEKRRFDMTGFDEGDKANLQEEADEEEEKVDKRALAEMEG